MKHELPTDEIRHVPFWRPVLLATVVAAASLAALAAVQHQQMGRSSTERLLTEAALPLGLLWFASFWLVISALLRRRCGDWQVRIMPPLVLWLLVSAAGNRWIARQAMLATEYPAMADVVTESDKAYDLVVVLGGGVAADDQGRARLDEDGDRIRPIIQLWRQGRAQRLVVTGTSTEDGRPGPAEVTEGLLRSFGIPAGVIERVEGRNTAEEMLNLRLYADEWYTANGRLPTIALVTSAFHMPRALRLAGANGLSPTPVPAARRSDIDHPIGIARTLVPTADALEDLSRCWKERLAATVGR